MSILCIVCARVLCFEFRVGRNWFLSNWLDKVTLKFYRENNFKGVYISIYANYKYIKFEL